jgi:nicotinate dehydrogenase subunit A
MLAHDSGWKTANRSSDALGSNKTHLQHNWITLWVREAGFSRDEEAEKTREQHHPMKNITLNVNGQQHVVAVDPETPLLFVLNDELGLRGPRFGCGMAQCGACTVIMRGQVVRSCVLPVSLVGEDEVTTLEGLGTPQKPHPIQQAFIEEGAAQCGFCLSGVILTAKAVVDVKPDASDQEIRAALGGILCRCFAHTRMLRAIRRYAEARRA